MTELDWIILIVVGLGAILGFMKGLIKQLASIVGLIAGLLIARAMFVAVGEKLAAELDTSLTFAQVLAFILIWIIVPVLFLLLGNVLTRVIEVVHLGFVNRMLGAGVGALKFLLLVGIAIHFIEYIDSKDTLITRTVKKASVLYYPIGEFSNVFSPTVKNVTKQLIDTEICKRNPINM